MMEENSSGNYAIIEKFNNRYLVLFIGSYEDAKSYLPTFEELCSGISDVKMIDASNIDLTALQNGVDNLKDNLDNLFLCM